jgi:hypothetical protein
VDVAEKGIDSVHINALSEQLEEKLGCRVIVAAEYMLEDNYHEKILKEAISLSQKGELLEYYGEHWEFNLPSQNDDLMPELIAQARESVREELVQNRKRKQRNAEIQETSINSGFFGAEESKRRRKNDEALDTKQPEPSVPNVEEHLLKQVSHCRIRSK